MKKELDDLMLELSLKEKAGLYGAVITGTLALALIILAASLPHCTQDAPEPAPAYTQKGR